LPRRGGSPRRPAARTPRRSWARAASERCPRTRPASSARRCAAAWKETSARGWRKKRAIWLLRPPRSSSDPPSSKSGHHRPMRRRIPNTFGICGGATDRGKLPPMKSDQPGLRERNRQERLARIKRAARLLLQKKGYDGTTLRMVGEKAALGTGTLFGYVQDKRDLVWMIFEDDHAGVTDQALATIAPDVGFVDQT